MKKIENQLIVILGASGDLTGRKLLPALYELHVRGLLPEYFAVLGAARTFYTDESYRSYEKRLIKEALKDRMLDEQTLDCFLARLFYLSFDSTTSAEYRKLKERIETLQQRKLLPDRVLYYLATPPLMYERIATSLAENGLHIAKEVEGWRRLVVEKPFGTSLESAQQLNRSLEQIFGEDNIYRIDHYLGKETVQNLLVLRFSNGIFEPLWNRNYIDSIEIKAFETLGVENRGGYYDGIGALRDMVQNHLMHLMAFIAMESPVLFEPEPIRDEIVKVFRALRPYQQHEMDRLLVRGQYKGYRKEKNVLPESTTETYVAMKLFIDNWRWGGVPFFIMTGKKLAERTSEIVINFKSTPHSLFVGQCSGNSCNKLIIKIQPNEGITLRFGLKIPGADFVVKQVGMDFRYDSLVKESLPDAYERLLVDVMSGDSMLFVRSDAQEASWKWIDPILHYWKEEGTKNLFFYKSGEIGPKDWTRLDPLFQKEMICSI